MMELIKVVPHRKGRPSNKNITLRFSKKSNSCISIPAEYVSYLSDFKRCDISYGITEDIVTMEIRGNDIGHYSIGKRNKNKFLILFTRTDELALMPDFLATSCVLKEISHGQIIFSCDTGLKNG